MLSRHIVQATLAIYVLGPLLASTVSGVLPAYFCDSEERVDCPPVDCAASCTADVSNVACFVNDCAGSVLNELNRFQVDQCAVFYFDPATYADVQGCYEEGTVLEIAAVLRYSPYIDYNYEPAPDALLYCEDQVNFYGCPTDVCDEGCADPTIENVGCFTSICSGRVVTPYGLLTAKQCGTIFYDLDTAQEVLGCYGPRGSPVTDIVDIPEYQGPEPSQVGEDTPIVCAPEYLPPYYCGSEERVDCPIVDCFGECATDYAGTNCFVNVCVGNVLTDYLQLDVPECGVLFYNVDTYEEAFQCYKEGVGSPVTGVLPRGAPFIDPEYVPDPDALYYCEDDTYFIGCPTDVCDFGCVDKDITNAGCFINKCNDRVVSPDAYLDVLECGTIFYDPVTGEELLSCYGPRGSPVTGYHVPAQVSADQPADSPIIVDSPPTGLYGSSQNPN